MGDSAYYWLLQSQRRQRLIRDWGQPLTATQLAHRLQMQRDECSVLLNQLALYGLVCCLNPSARRSRVFWLTDAGHACQRRVREAQGLAPLRFDFPVVDWECYGRVCYRHRAAIVSALTEPLQPAAIKRRARARDSSLRMSANNVRDALRELRQFDVVRPVREPQVAHARYELTDLGRCCQFLLRRAEH